MSCSQTSPGPAEATDPDEPRDAHFEGSEISSTCTSSTAFSDGGARPYHGGRTIYSWQCCTCGFINKMSRVYGQKRQYPSDECGERQITPKMFEALCQNHHIEKCAGRKLHDEGRLGINHIRCDRCTPHNKAFLEGGTVSRRYGDGNAPQVPVQFETEVFKTFQDVGGKVRTPSRRRSEEISQQHNPYRPEKKELQPRIV